MKKVLVPILILLGLGIILGYQIYENRQNTAIVQSTELHLSVELGTSDPRNCYVRAKTPAGKYITGYMSTSYCSSLVIGQTRVEPDGWSTYLKVV